VTPALSAIYCAIFRFIYATEFRWLSTCPFTCRPTKQLAMGIYHNILSPILGERMCMLGGVIYSPAQIFGISIRAKPTD